MMTPPTPRVFLLLSILLLPQSSHLSDPSAPSPSSPPSAGHHHRHQHRHRHHHGDRQHPSEGKAGREDDVRADGIGPGAAQPQRGGDADEARVEKHSAQQGVREIAPAGDGNASRTTVAMTTQSAAPSEDASDEASHGTRLGAGHADVPLQQSDDRQHKTGDPKEQPHLKTTPSPSPQSASHNSTPAPSLKSQQIDVSDQPDGQPSVIDHKDQDTISKTHVKGLSAHVQKDDDEASDEKLENRPRWRYILRQNEEDGDADESKLNRKRPLVKDNSSRNRPRNNKDISSGPEIDRDPRSDDQSDPLPGPKSNPDSLSGPTVNPDLVPRRWSHNRPRWDTSKHKAEDSDSSRPPNLEKQKKNANHTKDGAKANRKMKNQKMVKKNKKEREDLAEAKKDVKQKRKRKSKKNKPLVKGCPGCTPTEIKLAEARELHKQVLKAQLLDKLRLVPRFQRQPWPPKLPDHVFPDEAQRDEGVDEERYYARPTQLLLFGRDLGPRHRLKKAGTGSYKFGVRDKVKGEVTSARLWVYKMRDANDVHEQTLVITELQMMKRRRLRERSLVARLDTHVQEGWVSFDVTQLVRRWIENETPGSLQLLAIRCKTCHRTNYRAIFGVKSNFRPVLVIRETGERQGHRQQRSPCDPNNGCCKFDMTVSFEELGIHEIFRPFSIKADYCFGTCERPDAYHYNHTMIMQHMRFSSHVHNATLRQRLQPCCVPVVLREATIYHYLNAGLDSQVSLVPNLLVDRCGCA